MKISNLLIALVIIIVIIYLSMPFVIWAVGLAVKAIIFTLLLIGAGYFIVRHITRKKA